MRAIQPIDANGASEWMAMGAIVVRADFERKLPVWGRRLRERLGIRQKPDIHFRNLSPDKRLLACQLLTKFPATAFAVVSNKVNLRGYRNDAAARKYDAKQWFYNWCIRVILERVSAEVAGDSLAHFGEKRYARIVFSERGGHSYRHTQTYQELLAIQGKAGNLVLPKRSVDWETVHWNLMEKVSHRTSLGCQLADVVTSAFYQAADANRPKSWTTEYAEALGPIMAREQVNGEPFIADYGVTLMPWSRTARQKLTEDQKRIFRHYGYQL